MFRFKQFAVRQDRCPMKVGTGGHESYTPEYRALTRDFYLKF